MGGLSIWHILIVILVIMLLFGTKRLPGTMEDMAKGIKAFKKGLKDDTTTSDEVRRIQEDRTNIPKE